VFLPNQAERPSYFEENQQESSYIKIKGYLDLYTGMFPLEVTV
jgi:hypothetical protein